MIGVLGHDTGQGTTWANEMNFVMNYAPGGESIARPIDQQASTLPLSYGCPHIINMSLEYH